MLANALSPVNVENGTVGRENVSRWSEALEFMSYVRKEGRITLPKEVRDALSIDEGCLVRCIVEKVKLRQ